MTETLLDARQVIVVCGAGGVGKTTMSAALGVGAAVSQPGRTLVLTVDPAKRLAHALGLSEVGHDPVCVGKPGDRIGGDDLLDDGEAVDCPTLAGELHIAMLDMKQGWDQLIERHAPDAKTASRVRANPLYDNLTRRFVHSHDYLAMERLYALHTSGEWDLIIVDTPPSRSALSILDAPGRMRELFGSRLLKWLTAPYKSRLFSVASRPFHKIADAILGARFLQDIAEFFVMFQTMEAGFVERATAVEQVLADPATGLVVVTTPETGPAHEAQVLIAELQRRGLGCDGVIANRVQPAEVLAPDAAAVSAAMVTAADRIGADLGAATGGDPTVLSRVVEHAGESFVDTVDTARHEADRLADLETLTDLVLRAPMLGPDLTRLADLYRLSRSLT